MPRGRCLQDYSASCRRQGSLRLSTLRLGYLMSRLLVPNNPHLYKWSLHPLTRNNGAVRLCSENV